MNTLQVKFKVASAQCGLRDYSSRSLSPFESRLLRRARSNPVCDTDHQGLDELALDEDGGGNKAAEVLFIDERGEYDPVYSSSNSERF